MKEPENGVPSGPEPVRGNLPKQESSRCVHSGGDFNLAEGGTDTYTFLDEHGDVECEVVFEVGPMMTFPWSTDADGGAA